MLKKYKTDVGNSGHKILKFLIFGCFIAILLFFYANYPYKEILECTGNDCSVKKFYLLPAKNNTYYFNRTDKLKFVYCRDTTDRYYKKGYLIANYSDLHYVFDNNFINWGNAEEIIFMIKSKKDSIKITKYYFGYKIDK